MVIAVTGLIINILTDKNKKARKLQAMVNPGRILVILGIAICILSAAPTILHQLKPTFPASEQKEDTDRISQEVLIELGQVFKEGSQQKKEEALELYRVGSRAFARREYKTALSYFNKALDIKEIPSFFLSKGRTLLALFRNEEAIGAFDKALELKPDYAEVLYLKGDALRLLGRHDEAIELYDKALEIKPDYPEAWYGKGFAFFSLDRNEEEIYSWDKYLEIRSNDAKVWGFKIVALSMLGRYKEVIETCEKALEIVPGGVEGCEELLRSKYKGGVK